ncbi:response regulator transcription factor [Desulfobacter sp.]|uniref:response regulator transcription factor n=1 Tax=Desulfobacter sp. TaxID=2294 RepID=UPI003D1408D3
MRLLFVEDDAKIVTFVVNGLKQAGFAVDHAQDGRQGLDMLLTAGYDAAIVDIMLPRMDGISMVAQARAQQVKTPIIFLSARQNVSDRIRGLEAGADDYLVKPFAFAELVARLQALLRRVSGVIEPVSLKYRGFEMDVIKHRLLFNDERVELQPREFALLEYLMRHPDRIISKTMIMDHVWDYSFDPTTNVVEACVSRLRKKLFDQTGQKVIKTVKGIGYVLETPI